MKNIALLLVLNILTTLSFSQNNIDSLKIHLTREKSDENHAKLLHEISYAYTWTDTDSSMHYAQIGLDFSRKIKNIHYEVMLLVDISNALNNCGNNKEAIETTLKALRKAEETNDKPAMSRCYSALNQSFSDLKNYEEAIKFCYKAIEIDRKVNDSVRLTHDLINIGMNFLKSNKIDSSLYYSQEAYKLALVVGKWNYDMIGSIFITLGEIQYKFGNYDIALAYIKKGIESAVFYEDWIDCHNAYYDNGNIYKQLKKPDSCIKYYHLAYNYANKIKYSIGMLNSSLALADLYRNINKDSTLKYLELGSSLKDSIYNEEKLHLIQNIAYNEDQYQKKEETQKNILIQEKKENMVSASIALSVISLLITFLAFSHSIIANPKLIRFMGVLSLLIIFEFLNLLLHPYLGKITHHSQVLMLLIMVCIASLLVPLHHKMENWITQKLIEKNNRIRLSSAKKTIEKIEAEQQQKIN